MKEVKGYEGYYVTEDGRVFSKWVSGYGGKLYELKPHKTINGYYQCSLSKDGKRTFKKVHRIVAEAFIPNPENKSQINHIDLDKAHNNVGNLEWCDQTKNMHHARERGVYSKPRPSRRKKTIIDGVEYESRTEAAKRLNIPLSSVSRYAKYGPDWRKIENARIREARKRVTY